MQRSGLECHPQATECWVSRHWQGLLALLSPWQLNYSLKGEKSAGDPANFSMGLLAVLVLGCPVKRDKLKGKWSVNILLNIFMKWTSPTLLEGALCDSLTCGKVGRSCVSWTDMVLAAFKDTEQQRVGVWIRPLQIYWVHSHHQVHPAAARVVLKVGDFASFRHPRECLSVPCPFLSGTEPVGRAEVNLAYDILCSTESPQKLDHVKVRVRRQRGHPFEHDTVLFSSITFLLTALQVSEKSINNLYEIIKQTLKLRKPTVFPDEPSHAIAN